MWSLVAIVCLLLGIFVYQAARTALALNHVKSDAATLARQAKDGDVKQARTTLRDLADQAHTARSHSDNFLWSAAAAVPWIGDDVRAVRVAARAVDTTSRSAAPVALRLYQSLKGDRLRSRTGKFNASEISRLSPGFETLLAGATRADRELGVVDAGDLKLAPVRAATLQFQARLDSLLTLARAGSTASRVLPDMLGARGPRTYLMAEQNNAEIRSSGGVPGSFSVIHVRDGRLSLGQQLSDRDFPDLSSPILPLTPDELALHTNQLAENITAATATPDFPRAAQILDARYRARSGQRVDGVISVDPVALSFLLRATGPVKAGGLTLTSENVVRELLNETYLRISDPAQQDARFSSAAKGIFNALSSRPVSQTALLSEFARMVDQRRFLVWSRHASERTALAGTMISGELPRGRAAATRAGMYLNGAVGTKMQYYLDYTGHVGAPSCSDSGTQQFAAQLRLSSSAPLKGAGLTPYITGGQKPGDPPKGTMLVRLFVFGPTGGRVVALEANGHPVRLVRFRYDGRPVAYLNLLLRPKGHLEVTASLRTAPGTHGDPAFDWTPGIRSAVTRATVTSACG